MLIEPSAPILNLFDRADEGIERRDWKYAIDSLQRIIDEPGGSLVPRENGHPSDILVYESTRRRAQRILLDLPPEAMSAYRILYDGKAKGLYERAVADGEIDPLREIIDRFPLTRYGDDACDTLASWLIDEGRYGETIDVLSDCLSIVPEFDVSRVVVEGKLAAALAALGRAGEAKDVIARLRERSANEGSERLLDALAEGAITREWADVTNDYGIGAHVRATPGPAAPAPNLQATLVDPVPWRYDLPGNVALIWKRIVNDAPDDPVPVPAVQAVTDGARLFVRRPNGCAALDIDDLNVVWETTADSGPRNVLDDDFGTSGDRETWSRGGGFEDFIAGTITLAQGLLFTIEWEGSPLGASADLQLQTRRFVRQARTTSANRLVAYDPHTGAVIWQRGRTFDAEDPLGEVEFRAGPLAVEGRLWVPVVAHGDVYLVVLDPADGSLIRQMLLGSFQNFDRLRKRVLSPTYRDGLVFIPSSRGVVFAVDAHTITLRWATRYELVEPVVETWHEQQRRFRGQLAPGDRLESVKDVPRINLPDAPVVSRGLVLVLSEESRELVALTATNGAFRWATAVPGAAYILGADDERVWLVGRTVLCVSLLDGSIVWETPLERATTGWAVLTEDHVQLPTAEGLFKLDRQSGAPVELDPLPSTQPPLGNLMAVANSLISVEPSSVRKYPDVPRSFASAKAAVARNPDDVRAAERLAWMFLFQGEPSDAFDTLNDLPDDVVALDPMRARNVAHLRVRALQAMADEPDRDDREALVLLERARSLAVSPQDRLRVGFAFADKQSDLEFHAEAYQTLWELGLSDAASETITINDTVETAARLEIARRMKSMGGSAEATENVGKQGLLLLDQAAVDARAEKAAKRLAARSTLRALAELATPVAVSVQALIEWADLEADADRYERADQLLRWSVRLSENADSSLAALLRLYALYHEETGPTGKPTQDILHVLAREYGAATATAQLIRGMNVAVLPEPGMTIGAWVRATQAHQQPATTNANDVPTDAQARPINLSSAWELAPKTFRDDEARSPFELHGDLKQSLQGVPVAESPRMIHLNEPAQSFMHDRILFHAGGDVIYCQRPSDGALLWETSLRAPHEFDETVNVNRGRLREGIRRAVSDGQTVVINGTDGLYALGALTGRRLWVRPYETPSRPGNEAPLDWRLATRDGLLAAMPNDGRLMLMRMVDGSTVWERDLRGEIVAVVTMSEDRVVTADPKLQRVLLFDRFDGAEVGTHVFRQPDPERNPVMLVQTGPVVCGPDSTPDGDAVLAISVENGEQAWRIPVGKPIVSLFEPAEGLIGVGMLGGDLMIIEAETGTALYHQHLPAAHLVQEAKLHDATLVVRAITMKTANRQPALIGIDLPTGQELWRRDDLAQGAGTEIGIVINEGVIPAIVAYDEPGGGQNRARLGLALIGANDGETRAFARDVLPPRSRTQTNGDVAVWSDVAVIGTSLGIRAFRAVTEAEATEGS